MRLLIFLLALAPLGASAQGNLTLEELGALYPDRECFTGHEDLPLVGLSNDLVAFDPAWLEERGGGYTVQDVGDVSFIGGPWTYDNIDGDAVNGTLGEFLRTHGDDYDFVSMFTTEHLQFGALYGGLANSTLGIGRPTYPNNLPGHEQLMGFLFMNSIFDYLYDNVETVRDAAYFGQELGHRWGSFVRRRGGGYDMLGRDDSHWSFFMDSDNSAMEGNDWVETAQTNRWETNFRAPIGYSQLDMYLMGFVPPTDVDPWLLIKDPVPTRNPYGWGGEAGLTASSTPYYNVLSYVPEEEWDSLVSLEVRGTPVDVSIDDVVFAEGARNPDSTLSQRDFRMAFVIMHPESAPVDFDDYLVVEDTRIGLKQLWEDMVSDEATLTNTLATSSDYLFKPSVFTPDVIYEPAQFDVDENGDLIYEGDVPGEEGCQSSVAGGTGGLFGLLALAIGRRRSGGQRQWGSDHAT